MKLRILLSAMLVTALALPVIATATRFPDVPNDHQHADGIRWASDPEEFNGNPIFKGFPDGNFGPDEKLTEGQFVKVVDRLFDSADRWTRAETAALLYYGFQGLNSTTSTTTTQPVVIETTTTTIQPQNSDPQLQVSFFHWGRNVLVIRWIRPGWESQGWKWRIHNGHKINGASSWQVGSLGWSNILSDRSWSINRYGYIQGLRNNWQLEILWDNGERFISEPCVLRTPVYAVSSPPWECPDTTDTSDWPDYSHIPPEVSFRGPEFHSESNDITSFDIMLTPNRINSGNFQIRYCGKKEYFRTGIPSYLVGEEERRWGLGNRNTEGLAKGGVERRIRLHCASNQITTRIKVSYGNETIVNELISIPIGTNTKLNAQQLNPYIQPEFYSGYLDVVVGDSELARRSTMTYYYGGTQRRDNDGTFVSYISGKEFDNGRFRIPISPEVGGTVTLNIQVNEPGAPTHHLEYTFTGFREQ